MLCDSWQLQRHLDVQPSGQSICRRCVFQQRHASSLGQKLVEPRQQLGKKASELKLLQSTSTEPTRSFHVNGHPKLINPWLINRGCPCFSGESSLLEVSTPQLIHRFMNPGSTFQENRLPRALSQVPCCWTGGSTPNSYSDLGFGSPCLARGFLAVLESARWRKFRGGVGLCSLTDSVSHYGPRIVGESFEEVRALFIDGFCQSLWAEDRWRKFRGGFGLCSLTDSVSHYGPRIVGESFEEVSGFVH